MKNFLYICSAKQSSNGQTYCNARMGISPVSSFGMAVSQTHKGVCLFLCKLVKRMRNSNKRAFDPKNSKVCTSVTVFAITANYQIISKRTTHIMDAIDYTNSILRKGRIGFFRRKVNLVWATYDYNQATAIAPILV